MDQEDRLISELDSDQANALDSIIGRKIWNIEVLEDKTDTAIKILFSEQEGDYVVIYGENVEMFLLHPKPEVTH
jgi:hypothetical protein